MMNIRSSSSVHLVIRIVFVDENNINVLLINLLWLFVEHSSRLLDPSEYLFDVLSECVQSHVPDYHLIVKRMLWFNLPIIADSGE